jgi:hypothetical protein
MANPSTKYNPERGPNRKRRLGPNTESLAGKHPGRTGLMGQPKDSLGYVENKTLTQKPSGPGGSD